MTTVGGHPSSDRSADDLPPPPTGAAPGARPEREGREGDTQPMPRGNKMPHSHDMAVEFIAPFMAARKELGTRRYGQPLQPHNGRDSLQDAIEELGDGLAYLVNAKYERDHPAGFDDDGNAHGVEDVHAAVSKAYSRYRDAMLHVDPVEDFGLLQQMVHDEIGAIGWSMQRFEYHPQTMADPLPSRIAFVAVPRQMQVYFVCEPLR